MSADLTIGKSANHYLPCLFNEVTRQLLNCPGHVKLYTSFILIMFSDSLKGSVPAYYREVYEILCPHNEQVDKDLFIQLLLKSSLPRPTISQVNAFFHDLC